MTGDDVVIKQAPPIRLAELSEVAGGFGPDQLGPVFGRLGPRVMNALKRSGARPGICVGYYNGPAPDGSVDVHVGFEIGPQVIDLRDANTVELPSIKVASLMHRGTFENIEGLYTEYFRWMENAGYTLVAPSRELYLKWEGPRSPQNLTEIQLPIAKKVKDKRS